MPNGRGKGGCVGDLVGFRDGHEAFLQNTFGGSHYPAHEVSLLIHEGRISEALRVARGLRVRLFKGAAQCEILALVHSRRENEIQLAKRLADELKAKDLYRPARPHEIPTAQHWLRAASWILLHELPSRFRDVSYNPAQRLENLAFANFEMQMSLSSPDRVSGENLEKRFALFDLSPADAAGFAIKTLAQGGRHNEAFFYLKESLEQLGQPLEIRKAASFLFESINPTNRVDLLLYRNNQPMTTVGIAVVRSAGFIVKEYSGFGATVDHLGLQETPEYSRVELLDWVNGWSMKWAPRAAKEKFWKQLEKAQILSELREKSGSDRDQAEPMSSSELKRWCA
jgi:hypothetical protein